MDKIVVNFENCYGIRKLDAEFDFSKKHAQLIYAPNGAMKSSFAKTFKDHSLSQASSDRVYPDRKTSRKIVDENGVEIDPNAVFVIDPYDGDYQSGRVSTLLVNKELKAEYDGILKTIDSKLENLFSKLKKVSGVNKGLEDIYSQVITKKLDNVLRALERVRAEVESDDQDSQLDGIKYKQIFNEKVEPILDDEGLKEALSSYTDTYENLLEKSKFFKKGVFNHYQASEIAKQLKNHGFFQAEHKVYLHSGDGDTKVETEDELAELISTEMQEILSSPELKSQFEKIDKKLTNRELREFREFLLANKGLIPRLNDPEVLKEDLLRSYLITYREDFLELMSEYSEGKKRLDEILKAASDQATRWQEVINIFNRRFSVPFKVAIENKQDVILKRATPNIGFTFSDRDNDHVGVERGKLLDVLSNGERRALYILNIIFEVEARKSEGINTIFVVDDVADSFDYKNKYAIVEYLSDILSEDFFRQVILTHNYDFYRTVWKRLELGGVNFHVAKSEAGIELSKEKMYRDPFEKWKANANADENIDALLAMIPFVRNLAEYCGYADEFSMLTRLLHIKSDSDQITIEQLFNVYGKVLNGHKFEASMSGDTKVVPVLLEAAKNIAAQGDSALDLEKKVVLSIAIRLLAERQMIAVIDDADWVSGISKNQTAVLLRKVKELFGGSADMHEFISLMDRVNLMTPENIHLNSFMYEPILDMSAEHLARLYGELEASKA